MNGLLQSENHKTRALLAKRSGSRHPADRFVFLSRQITKITIIDGPDRENKCGDEKPSRSRGRVGNV